MLHQNDYFLPDSKSKNGVLLQNHGQYNLDWHEHNSPRISRIKHLRQTLDPDRYQTDSTYRSIETIRPGAPALKRFEPSSSSVMIQGWEDPGLSAQLRFREHGQLGRRLFPRFKPYFRGLERLRKGHGSGPMEPGLERGRRRAGEGNDRAPGKPAGGLGTPSRPSRKLTQSHLCELGSW